MLCNESHASSIPAPTAADQRGTPKVRPFPLIAFLLAILPGRDREPVVKVNVYSARR
jgi:hypothetical protein